MKTNPTKRLSIVIAAAILTLCSSQTLSVMAAEENLAKLKPEDWVKDLPEKARTDFIQSRSETDDERRLMAMRSWMAVWRSKIKEPYGNLVDLDYVEKSLDSKRISFQIGKQIAMERQELTAREGILANVSMLIRTAKPRVIQDEHLAATLGKHEKRLEKATEIARRSKDQLFNWESKWGYHTVPHPEDWKKKTKHNPHWYWPK